MLRRFTLILSLVLITTCSSASAQSVGLSTMALCHPDWPCGALVEALKDLPILRFGWLEQTFGEECKCVDKLLRDGRPKEVRVHIANGACLRNNRCGPYEIFHKYKIVSASKDIKRLKIKLINKFAKVLDRLRDRLANSRGILTCYVSPVLESDFDGRTRKILHRITASHLPGCTLVDNPVRGKCIGGAVCERHGPNPGLTPPCIADLDGNKAEEVSVPEYLAKTKACDMSFVWSVGLNCNSHHSQTFIDPRKRDCAESRGDIEALAGWLHGEFR